LIELAGRALLPRARRAYSHLEAPNKITKQIQTHGRQKVFIARYSRAEAGIFEPSAIDNSFERQALRLNVPEWSERRLATFVRKLPIPFGTCLLPAMTSQILVVQFGFNTPQPGLNRPFNSGSLSGGRPLRDRFKASISAISKPLAALIIRQQFCVTRGRKSARAELVQPMAIECMRANHCLPFPRRRRP